MSELLTTQELADYLHLSTGHILNERTKPEGHPLFSKGFRVGRKLFFKREDVQAYIEECARA